MNRSNRALCRHADSLLAARSFRVSVFVALASFAGWNAGPLSADEVPPRSLFVMNRDGSGVRNVIRLEDFPHLRAPRWSHEGRRLVFYAGGNKADRTRLFVVNSDGSGLAEAGPGTLADWSPDDKQFAFAAGAGTALKEGIWVQNSDGRGRQWLAPGTAPRWSPDGSQIAHIANGLKILDLAEGATRDFVMLSPPVRTVYPGFDWSPDGSRLALVWQREGGANELVIIDAAQTNEPPRIRAKGPADDVAWSPDGETLAVSIRGQQTGEHRIHLLPADGDDPPEEIPGQQGDTCEPAWSADGALLAFTSLRRDILTAPTATENRDATLELVRAYDKGGTVYSVGLTPDGRTAFVGGDMTNRGVLVWDTTSGDPLRTISLAGIFVAVSPDGRHGACAPFLGGNVHYVDLEDGSTIREFAHQGLAVCLQFSGDGSRLVTAGSDKAVCVFDVASGEQLARIEHPDDVKQVAFSPDGTLVASTCTDRNLYLWNATTGAKVREFAHPACPWGVAFSPDGRQLMTGTGGVLVGKRSSLMVQPEDDNSVRIWDVESGKLVRKLDGHTHTVCCVAFSPTGKRAVSASFDRSLRLWDVESGRELSRIDGQGWFTSVAISSDGTLVLASGGAEKDFQQRRWFEYPDERVRLFRIVNSSERASESTGPSQQAKE